MSKKKAPVVKVADTWVPAHRMWDVVEAINTATDLVERFNEQRPELTTKTTRDVVGKVRQRIRAMELEMGGPDKFKEAAIDAGVLDPDAEGAQGDNAVAEAEAARGSTDVAAPGDSPRALPADDLAEAAKQLIGAMSVEEALAMLKADYDNPMDIPALVELVGTEAYLDAMRREGAEFQANMIAADQIAELWNESGYHTPEGGIWTTAEVEKLLG